MQPVDKEWYKAFRLVHKDLFEFVKGEYPAILKWAGSAGDADKFYQQAQKAQGGSSAAAATQ